MSGEHDVNPDQRLLFGLTRRTAGRIGIGLLALLVGIRAVSELNMMREYRSDAQMGIWVMLFVWIVGFWLMGGALGVGLIIAMWRRRWASLVGIAALLLWAAAICYASWSYNTARRALADAANPATSPDRLRELVQFDGIQAGYELDNRLAANRNTPPDALRELSLRDQLGTQMKLKGNPNTPMDVLQRLSAQSTH